jgi:2-dehydro-3-deoxyphosphogluconate aldolase/(4S)-4-hydroxy-2-oxoglutarate aldolase
MTLHEILKCSPVVPVVVIKQEEDAIPLAHALLEGGIKVIEITLRTSAALAAIQQISKHIPEMIVGAGTVLNSYQLLKTREAGAQFAVSPGLTPELLQTARENEIPYLPGIASATDIMQALSFDFHIVKPFPIELLGSTKWLTSHKAVFPHLSFFPSGGITKDNMKHYLALESVLAVGGTWLTPAELIKRKDWAGITALVKETLA